MLGSARYCIPKQFDMAKEIEGEDIITHHTPFQFLDEVLQDY